MTQLTLPLQPRRELEPAADRDDRDARLAFLAVRRAQIDELWGKP